MTKIFKFGEDVEGYDIPVLNEREIRAAAGLLFAFMFVAIMTAILKMDFLLIKFTVCIFLTDILIRVLISPRFSPTLIMGRYIVRNQVPEYVGAKQKKFAWIIGIVLASAMFIHLVPINAYSPITGLTCITCLVFLFFETAFGICLGCIFYKWLYKEKAQYCPGEVCEVKSRQEIQKVSMRQKFVLVGFMVFIILLVVLFNENFSEAPFDLFGIDG
jgi:hypothetical protein